MAAAIGGRCPIVAGDYGFDLRCGQHANGPGCAHRLWVIGEASGADGALGPPPGNGPSGHADAMAASGIGCRKVMALRGATITGQDALWMR